VKRSVERLAGLDILVNMNCRQIKLYRMVIIFLSALKILRICVRTFTGMWSLHIYC